MKYPLPPGFKPFQSTSIHVNPELHIYEICIAWMNIGRGSRQAVSSRAPAPVPA
jgi:hypothetical protein